MFHTTTQLQNALRTAALLVVIWAVAAAFQPTSTYHLAPILVAGILPVLAGAARIRGLVGNAALGAALAATAALLLAALDLLRGPTLLPYGGALAEALTFAGVGAVGGALIGIAKTAMTSRQSAV